MRRSFFTLSCILLFLTVASVSRTTAQLLNPGFETWSGGEPVSWATSNNPEWAPSSVNVTQTPDSHEGMYALRGEAVSTFDIYLNDTSVHTPSIRNKSLDGLIRPFPISSRPKQLRGYWKFQAVGAPLLGVTVWLFKGENVIASGGTNRFAPAADTAYRPFIAPISYFNDDTPDTAYISIGISFGDVGSVFYLDDLSFSFLEVLKPAYNDIVISGEPDTIAWAPISGNLDIFYSLNNGSTYLPIVTNYPATSGMYIWDVPDTLLSTKARIKIVDSAEPDDEAVSDRFYMKRWQLTRIDNSGNFKLFKPAEDGWSLRNDSATAWPQSWWQQFNYRGGIDPNNASPYPHSFLFSRPADIFPDWPLFVDVFGVEQCYLDTTSPPFTYSGRALRRWAWISGTWGGSCEGFAVSSLLSFYHRDGLLARFGGIGSHTDLFTVGMSTDARAAINQYFTHQFGDPFKADGTQRRNAVDARQTLAEAKEMLSVNNVEARPLGFYNNNGSGGHAVTPYKLQRDTIPTTFILRVYDSNNPGATNRGIELDSAANTWTDLTGLGWGTGVTGCFLGLPSEQHFTTPGLSIMPGAQPRAGASLFGGASDLEIYNTSGAAITIKTISGDSIGYADSIAFGNMVDAVPIIPRTGSFHPPIGYALPAGDYSLEMRDVADSSGYIGFITDSLIYNYSRDDFQNNETDRLMYSGGVGITNPDATSKIFRFETIISAGRTERIFVLSDLMMSPGDSLHIAELNHEALVTKNFGGATQYDLDVKFAGPGGTDRFFHASMPIGAGAGHQIVPDWGDVEGTPMKILIDAGNDGSIDDSMFVTNQLTEVEDRIASGIPAAYSLGQNYPNPFNPVTTISFDLPELSIVSLKIYNLVGEEIATLADGVRQAGTYRVTFDGTDLPSGVYVYRLMAGTFSAGGKMVLLK